MIHIYDFLITLLKPLIVLIGKIGMPHRKVTGETYYKIRHKIYPGMVLLTKTNWEMSNLINPCPIKHAALYVGDGMSKFFEAMTELEHVINSYAEAPAIKEVILRKESFEKIRFIVRRELELDGHITPHGEAFGFEYLAGNKGYFKCRGIKFIKEMV